MKSILQKIRKIPGDPEHGGEKLMEKAFESLAGEEGAFRVLRRDDRGQLKMLDVLPRDSVLNPDDLMSVLQERWGGGRYHVVPTKNGKKFGVGFGIEFDGQPKKTKKTADDNAGEKRTRKRTETDKEVAQLRDELRELKEKDREDRLLERVRQEIEKGVGKRDGSGEVIDAIFKNFPEIVAGLSGLLGSRESASDMLEKISTIWKNVESSMPQVDPVEQVKGMAEVIFTIVNQSSRAPVSTTGSTQTGGAFSNFVAGVIAELEKRYLGGMAAPAAGGGPVAALASGGSGFAGSPPASSQETGSGGIGGFPGGATQQPATEQPQDILAGFDMKSLGVDPEARLRNLLASREDPENVAEVAVYLLNFVGTFAVPDSPIGIYIQNFFANPGMMFDQAAPMIPELHGASEKYLSDLRGAIITEVQAYARERAEETAARMVADAAKQTDEAEEKTLTPEQRQAQETAGTERQDADEKVEDEKVEDVEPESEVREEAPA